MIFETGHDAEMNAQETPKLAVCRPATKEEVRAFVDNHNSDRFSFSGLFDKLTFEEVMVNKPIAYAYSKEAGVFIAWTDTAKKTVEAMKVKGN